MFFRIALRFAAVCAVIAVVLVCTPAFAAETEEESHSQGTLPEIVEQSLTDILKTVNLNSPVPHKAVADLLQFCLDGTADPQKVIPEKRTFGTGAFYTTHIAVPLRDFMRYTLNPLIPSAALYPTTVRRNAWHKDSGILTEWKNFTEHPFPADTAQIFVMRGTETEETTPDESSGCIYQYDLERLFILTGHAGRPVLVTVSVMPRESSVGTKCAVVDEKKWLYMYTSEIGTNLPLLGWAKTAMYGSAGVTVYIQDHSGNGITMYSYKWTKAGWSGINAVKRGHIIRGAQRFADGMKQVIEAANAPSPDTLSAEATRISALTDAELRAALTPHESALKRSSVKQIRKKPYKTLLEADYIGSLSRAQAEAEAIRLKVRALLGI